MLRVLSTINRTLIAPKIRKHFSSGTNENSVFKRFESGKSGTNGKRYNYYLNGANQKGNQQRWSLLFGLATGTALLSAGFFLLQKFAGDSEPEEEISSGEDVGGVSKKKRVVVVGGGFAGLSFTKEISTKRYDVVLLSPQTYFLFTPLLSSYAFGSVDTSSLAIPIRLLIRFWNRKVKFVEAEVTDIDPKGKYVVAKVVSDNSIIKIPYDKLVLSTGSEFGNTQTHIKGAQENSLHLRSIEDARRLRRKVLDAFEAASLPGKSEKEVLRLLNFLVVGSNPASIQFVKDMDSFLDEVVKMYPALRSKTRVTIVSTPDDSLINIYDKKMQLWYQKNELEKLKKSKRVQVLSAPLKSLEKNRANFDSGVGMDFGVCVWFSGLAPLPLIRKLKAKNPKEQNNARALVTNEWQQVRGFEDVYAIGECSTLDQEHILKEWDTIFQDLDENGDGFIDEQEFEKLDQKYSRKYPQLLGYAAAASHRLFQEGDVNQDNKLSRDEFRDLLKKVDSTMTSFPSTAQTAYQQGIYLAGALNSVLRETEVRKLFEELDTDKSGYLDKKEIRLGLRKLGLRYTKEDIHDLLEGSDTNHDNRVDEAEFLTFVLEKQQQGNVGDWKKLTHSRILPFRYKHLGGFEYVGYTDQITERGSRSSSVLDGFGAWWMYNSIYYSKLFGVEYKAKMLFDKATSSLFGRDLVKDYSAIARKEK